MTALELNLARRSFNQISHRFQDIFQLTSYPASDVGSVECPSPVFHQFKPVPIIFIKLRPLPCVASQESAEATESLIVQVAFGSILQHQPVELKSKSLPSWRLNATETHQIIPKTTSSAVFLCLCVWHLVLPMATNAEKRTTFFNLGDQVQIMTENTK